jgi:hypothetical protein
LLEIPAEKMQKSVIEESPEEEKKRLMQTFTPMQKGAHVFSKQAMLDYVRSRFLQNGVSVSALNNYLSCPWKYLFRNLIRLPDVRGYSLLLGTAIHDAIRHYIVQLKQGNPLTEEQLISYFKTSLTTLSASQRDLTTLETNGSLILSGYYRQRMQSWSGAREAEVVIPNMYFDTDISINGKIDMIELLPKNEVVVYDFKTGKMRSTHKEDYFRQLVFYKLLLSVYKKGQYTMNTGIIEYVETALDGELRSESHIISDTDVAQVKDEVRQMRDAVLSLSFWDTTCDDPACDYCKLRTHFHRPLV